MERYLREVRRVLRPGGYFSYDDFRGVKDIEYLQEDIKNSGLNMLEKQDITSNVLRALELDHDYKLRMIQRKTPKIMQKSFISFAGTKDSEIYQEFLNGSKEYFMYVFENP